MDGPIHLKLSLLGDGRVGKTSLRRQYLGQGFSTEYLETLGADFAIKTTLFKGITFRYQIWDIAGQQRFSDLRKAFFVGSQAAIILYDITNPSSYDNVINWILELWKHNGKGKNVPIILIGNKIDLRSEVAETLTTQAGYELANKIVTDHGLEFDVPFLETSAKTGENVDEAFQLMTDTFLKIHNIPIK